MPTNHSLKMADKGQNFVTTFLMWLIKKIMPTPKPRILTDLEFMKELLLIIAPGSTTGTIIACQVFRKQLKCKELTHLYVYTMLKTMVEKGWVVASERINERKIYMDTIFTITDLGRALMPKPHGQ